MNTSIILAQALGLMFSVLGLSMLLNKKNTVKVVDEMFQSKGLMWLGGFMALAIGATIIALNSAGNSNITLFVIILGWLSLIKGIFILVFPNSSMTFYKKANKENTYVWAGIVVFILGLILLL